MRNYRRYLNIDRSSFTNYWRTAPDASVSVERDNMQECELDRGSIEWLLTRMMLHGDYTAFDAKAPNCIAKWPAYILDFDLIKVGSISADLDLFAFHSEHSWVVFDAVAFQRSSWIGTKPHRVFAASIKYIHENTLTDTAKVMLELAL